MKAIQDYLKLTGMTQDALAKKAGLNPAALNHFLRGRRDPSVKNLCKLSEATGISLERLVGNRK